MGITKPFHRNYRPVKEGNNAGYSDWAYIIDHEYANTPEHYTRAFLLIQEDILKLFQYIEPSHRNEKSYSYRIHELLMRICIEIEANFKAILKENIFSPVYKRGPKKGEIRPEDKWNINDFRIVNKTHHLDDYKIELPFWKGDNNVRKPFIEWKTNENLSWYQAYNNSKHNRLENFEQANFKNLVDAYAGLGTILSSQFRNIDFQPGPDLISSSGYSYFRKEFGIGNYLMVEYPNDWAQAETYEFDWTKLKEQNNRFEKIDYNKV